MLRRGSRELVVLLAAVVTGCGAGVEGTPVAAPAGGLDSILLGDVDIDDVLGTKGIQSEPDTGEMTDELAAGTVPPGCAGTVRAAEANVYRDAGTTAALTRMAQEPGDGDSVAQSVVVVGSPQQAQHLLELAKLSWSACAGTPIRQGGATPSTWNLEPVDVRDGIVSQQSTNSVHGRCQHAMGAAAARVVEALVCGPNVRTQGAAVVAAMITNAGSA
ncbi:PknH-like protein [Mycobacterium sp. BK558]|nr:PknH-like protein [Mycobacterium sp. BK558]